MALNKFNRNYRIIIQDSVGSTSGIEICSVDSAGLTIEFDLQRSVGSSINQMGLKIYNLGENKRKQIFQDRIDVANSTTDRIYRRITFQAGYNNHLSTIFIGNLAEAYSSREGSNIITYIRALDGGFATYNSFSSFTLNAGSSLAEIFTRVTNDLNPLSRGTVAPIIGSINRGLVIVGNSWNELKNNFPNRVFIDLEQVNYLDDDQCKIGFVPRIDSSSGLLSTPRRMGSFVNIELLFEPQLVVGQFIEIRSSITPIFNGQYKIIGIKHTGIISGAVNGQCKTQLQLFIGTRQFSLNTVG